MRPGAAAIQQGVLLGGECGCKAHPAACGLTRTNLPAQHSWSTGRCFHAPTAVALAAACQVTALTPLHMPMQDDSFGQLGIGGEQKISSDETELASAPQPAAVAGGHSFAAISAGFSHTCGLTLNGSLLCWGENSGAGQPPRPVTNIQEPTPPVWAGSDEFRELSFVALSAADDSTCALDAAGALWCFGEAAALAGSACAC